MKDHDESIPPADPDESGRPSPASSCSAEGAGTFTAGPDVALILNAKSGSADRLGELLLSLDGLRLELVMPGDAADLQHYVRQASGRLRRMIVAGGDGTLNCVVNALGDDSSVDLALLPLGTGNDFSRCLGFAELSIHDVFSIAMEGRVDRIDAAICRTDEREFAFVNVANGGLGGRIAALVDGDVKQTVGPAAYWLASAQALTDLVTHRVELTVDSQSMTCDLIGLAIANGRFAGGGFEVAPYAQIDDGELDLTLIPDLSALQVLTASTRYVLDGQPDETPAEAMRGRRVEFRSDPPMPFSIDGESFEIAHGVVECRPEALSFVAPRGVREAPERPRRPPEEPASK